MHTYRFKSIYELLNQVNVEFIKETIGNDYFEKIIQSSKQKGTPGRVLQILERWLNSQKNLLRIQELLLTTGRKKKLILELQEQAELEQDFLEEEKNIYLLKNGLMEYEILKNAPFDLNLKIR